MFWAKRLARAGGLRWPTGIIGAIAVVIGWCLKDILGDLVKRVLKFALGGLLGPDAMGDATAAFIGVVAFVAFTTAAFLFGYVYSIWRRPELHLTRNDLEKSDSGVNPYADIKSASCVFLVGQKFIEQVPDGVKVKMILPDPDSASVEFINSTMKGGTDSDHLREMIKITQDKGFDVRKSEEFSGSAWWIGNRDEDDPFVHVEVILPFLTRPYRPSFRVYRSQDAAFYKRYCELFDNLWNKRGTKKP